MNARSAIVFVFVCVNSTQNYSIPQRASSLKQPNNEIANKTTTTIKMQKQCCPVLSFKTHRKLTPFGGIVCPAVHGGRGLTGPLFGWMEMKWNQIKRNETTNLQIKQWNIYRKIFLLIRWLDENNLWWAHIWWRARETKKMWVDSNGWSEHWTCTYE